MSWRPSSPIWAAAGLIVLAVVLTYYHSFRVPFHFDDRAAIEENPTIRHLSSIWNILSPPRESGTTVNGRPLVNLSVALNYAISGTKVWSYHAVNIALHLCAALAILGIMRRTLSRACLRDRFGSASLPLALAVSLLWSLHPLQTEAVTYIVQRAESLAALFCLLTLYTFIRSVDSPLASAWLQLSVFCCLLGMASKETMVTAPLIIFLYDRTFVAGNFREAWRRRSRYYLGLATTWLLLATLVLSSANRGGTAGFGGGVSWWQYSLTQCEAVVRYLRLAVWPRGLVFDYGMDVVEHAGEVWPQMLLLAGLVSSVAIALRRWPATGFAGAWFFILLSPSSSVVPVTTQTIAEHRVYLPLAALVALATVGMYAWLGRRSFFLFGLLALGLGILTARRNEVYLSELTLWRDCVAKRPDNARAQNNLGKALIEADDVPGALTCFAAALRLRPDYPETHNNLGYALAKTGHLPEALKHYEEALRLRPTNASAHDNMGNALAELGQSQDAVAHFQEALRLKPGLADAHWGLGNVLVQTGKTTEASAQYAEALRLDPTFAEAHYGLAAVAARNEHTGEAIAQYREALRLRSKYPEAQNNLGNQLLKLDQVEAALGSYRAALAQKPTYSEARNNLANTLLASGRSAEAMVEYNEVLRTDPSNIDARYGLGTALAQLDRLPEAIETFRQALELQPDHLPSRANLGNALLLSGHLKEAIQTYEEAVRLKPDDVALRTNLEQARSLARLPPPKN